MLGTETNIIASHYQKSHAYSRDEKIRSHRTMNWTVQFSWRSVDAPNVRFTPPTRRYAMRWSCRVGDVNRA